MWTGCQELPRVAKSWKIVFLNWSFRRDVRPRGLSLQGTIPSLSAMVFSRPGGAFLEAICVTKRFGNQLQQAQQKQRSSNNQSSSRAAYSRSRAAGRPCGQAAKSCQELEMCVF